MRTADKNIVYGMCTIGESGRILDRTMPAAAGWHPGSRLEVRCLDEGVLLVSDAVDVEAADTAVTAGRFFRIPYRQRRRTSLFIDDRALLIGHRARRRLLIRPAATLDEVFSTCLRLLEQ
ncbi:hypothetical protein GCM10023318_51940 [Nocardia callitridis]|uniref:Uncharacterized protein n=1 Tax=Nocardia callitridis TaxID=648753 RepID=A0ABP9KWG6_9NOCA